MATAGHRSPLLSLVSLNAIKQHRNADESSRRRGVIQRFKQSVRNMLISLPFVRFWKHLKKHFFQRYTVYILECDHDEYYVGSTANRRQRFREHRSSRGGGTVDATAQTHSFFRNMTDSTCLLFGYGSQSDSRMHVGIWYQQCPGCHVFAT
jgi:hypothetical protein